MGKILKISGKKRKSVLFTKQIKIQNCTNPNQSAKIIYAQSNFSVRAPNTLTVTSERGKIYSILEGIFKIDAHSKLLLNY